MRTRHIAAVAALLLGSASAQAQPVSVDYTVSGSAGNWFLNFTLRNNFSSPGDMGVYWFGVRTPSATVSASPGSWLSNGGWTTSSGSGTTYQNSWKTDKTTSLLPGQSLTGFTAQSFALAAPTSVQWFAYAFSNGLAESNGVYDVGDNFNGLTYNPGFESSSLGSMPEVNVQTLVNEQPPVTTTPEPSTYALMASGLAVLSYLNRRRRATV
ncbi:MAG: PEP-CTERM sorting domain-containing protein [Gemmatimonadaceae bacterium]|nr:PEP-CTERM sorting domain-containing protein [Gemmatimonadaceae bacterium]